MRFETPDKYAILLSAGLLEMEMPGGGWHAVHDGLRDTVIRTVLNGKHAAAVRKAVRQRRTIKFLDAQRDLLLRWSPCGVN
jgi:hypothetical protein